MAHRGTKRQITACTNRLTSPLYSSDNAEADGSIPSSPTKDLMCVQQLGCHEGGDDLMT